MQTTMIRYLGAAILIASLPIMCSWGETTKVLHFPADQCMGRVSVEDPYLGSEALETGRDPSYPFGFDPKRVCLAGNWGFVAQAQGDVAVPADRDVQLAVVLRPVKADASRLSEAFRRYLQSRVAADPEDLSGLSGLEPNDLHHLGVSSLVRRRDADRRILKPISHLTGLEVLTLTRTGVTDQQMACLRPLRSLRALTFTDELSLGNAGLAVLKDLPALQYLDLDTGAADAGLKHVGQLENVRWLRLCMGRIRGAGLAELARMPRLERLCLWGTKGLSDRHISNLEGLTQIKSLTLWGEATAGLGNATLASIGKLLSLEELHFIRARTKFTDAGVAHLRGLRNLRKVSFGRAPIGAEGLRHLAGLANLERIELMGLSTEMVEALAVFGKLKALKIGMMMPTLGASVPREDISGLARLRGLEELWLGGGRWDAEDLAFLESMGQFKHLSIASQVVTDQTIARIARLGNLEYLYLGKARLTKRGLNQLNGLTELRTLDVRMSSRDESGIDETPLDISGLTNLKELSLNGFVLRDSDLASVAGMRDLERLILQNGPPSEAALAYLKDLAKLKHLHVDGLSCTTGSGLAWLAGLESAGSLRLRGRITDAALRQMPMLPGLWSLIVETEEIIQPETVVKLRARLPAIQLIRVREPMHFGGPRPVKVRGSDGRTAPSRANPRGRQRR